MVATINPDKKFVGALEGKLNTSPGDEEGEVLQVEGEQVGKLIVVRATVCIHRSIKMAEYKYYKPGIELVGNIPTGMTASEAIFELKGLAREELQILIDEEKGLYRRAGEVAKLERIIGSYDEETTEYQLAYKELHGRLPGMDTGDNLA